MTSSKLTEVIKSKSWRLNNLYRIIDKSGNSIPFRLNSMQQKVIDSPHPKKLILKARQLGISTLAVLDLLDDTIFMGNQATGIVSYSLQHAQHIFKRIIGHAIDTFPEKLKPYLGIVTSSAREISFNNGSFLRVDTTLRGATYRNILISEFGKTCARTPMKAEEVVTGTLNAAPADAKIIIESTGEGMEGYFAEMCLEAQHRNNKDLTFLDYELFFFPWYEEKGYSMGQEVSFDIQLKDYFNEIEKKASVSISPYQRNWYSLKMKTLGDKMKQEFPSTVEEAFLSRSDAYYFAAAIEKAYKENRCLHTSLYDALEPVYVAMDIGINDKTVIIIFQVVHGEIRIIDMYDDENKGLDFYAKHLLQEKNYIYHTIFLPHDSVKRDPVDVVKSYESEFRRLFSGTNTRFQVLKRTDKQELISFAKNKFNRCVFNLNRTKILLDNLSKYRKMWNESVGRYTEKPLHDTHSDYADAFQYAMQGVGHIETYKSKDNYMAKHKDALEGRRRVV